MEVDVETDEIRALGAEKSGGWKAGESAKGIGINPLGFLDQFVNKIGHRPGTAPTDDVGRNFIGDAVGKDRRMAGTGIDGAADRFPRIGAVFGRIEEAQMAVP